MTSGPTRADVLAFRAGGHGLGRRRPAGDLAGAAGAIGLRRTKHTAVALAARVEAVAAGDLERALEDEELVVVYSARGTLMVVPVADVEIFTLGAAPADEASLRAAVPGAFLRRLDAAGVTVTDGLAASSTPCGTRSAAGLGHGATRPWPSPAPCPGSCRHRAGGAALTPTWRTRCSGWPVCGA